MVQTTPKFPATSSITFRDKSFPLLQTRPMSSLSVDTLEAMKLITLDQKYPPSIVGSFKYIVHEYPADIDMFEKYETCCDMDGAAKDVANKFKDMGRKIAQKKDVYLGDFKAGYDNRYKINIGHLNKHGKLLSYNPTNIRATIIALEHKGLLTKEQKDIWLSKVIDQPLLQEYMALEKVVRSKYVIRWSIEELIKGEKELPLGVMLSLENALSMKSIVKIDIWVYLSGRYVEMTNWYMILYKDAKTRNIKNLSVKPEKYQSSLVKDLLYYNNPVVNKYMKFAKRLWLYAVLKKDKKLMTSLYPLFSSGASKMYQIMGECETISLVLENVHKPDMTSIVSNIEDWKTRLGTVMSDILPIPVAHNIYMKIDDMLAHKYDSAFLIFGLEEIHDKLNQFVNRFVKLYMKRNRINIKMYLKST